MAMGAAMSAALMGCSTGVFVADAGDDAGCTSLLCVERVFINGGYNTATSGVIWGGPQKVTIVGWGGNSYPFVASWNEDAGDWVNGSLAVLGGDPIGTVAVTSFSADEYFVANAYGMSHVWPGAFEGGTCPPGRHPSFLSFMTSVSADSHGGVWFAGADDAVCKWEHDAGFSYVAMPDAGHDWSALLALSDGGLMLGDRMGQVVEGGTSAQLFSDRVTSFFQTGNSIWAGSSFYTGETGGLKRFTSASGWAEVDAGAGFTGVDSIWASSESDVWIGGLTSGVAHFDGMRWRKILIPGLPEGALITVVAGSGNSLVVGGRIRNSPSMPSAEDDAFAVVLRRR